MVNFSLSDRGQKAEGLLAENPYDLDAWGVLIREAQVKGFFNYFVFL